MAVTVGQASRVETEEGPWRARQKSFAELIPMTQYGVMVGAPARSVACLELWWVRLFWRQSWLTWKSFSFEDPYSQTDPSEPGWWWDGASAPAPRPIVFVTHQ